MDDLVKRLRRMDGDSMSIKTLDEAAAHIEALEARVAAADKLADQAQMVKDSRYDPNIGIELNFLEEALAAYQATKDQSE